MKSKSSNQIPKRWNLFARELENTLNIRGFRLGHLNDRVGLHPQKVSRLQHSLNEPRFNVLSPDDLEKVCTVFGFTNDERLRLHAAILATAIEEILMGRINNDDALLAAEQILPIIQQALRLHSVTQNGMGVIKSTPLSFLQEAHMNSFDAALSVLDHAMISLHLAYFIKESKLRAEKATQAREGFTTALELLHGSDVVTKSGDIWSMWYAEASMGFDTANNVITLSDY